MTTDCVKLLTELVAHRTVNPGGDEPALAAFLADQLRRLSADSVEVCEVTPDGEDSEIGAYVWATYGEPKTIINVHLDTVPVTSGWTRDPFTLTRDGDRLYGLGSADTKGAIAAVLTALAKGSPRDTGILFSGDEERRTRCMRAFLARGGGVAQRAIVCEPTGRMLGVRHRGIRAYRFETRGSGGHSSAADRSPKPLVTMARLALELNELGERYAAETAELPMPGLCLNIAAMRGGVAFNVIPERASLDVSVRPPPGFDSARFDAEIGTCIRAAATETAIETECTIAREPFATRHADGFAALLGDAPRGHVGLDFWTEAALLSEAGIDAVVIGPGDIAVAHGPDEFVPAADLDWATAMFEHVFAASRP